MNAAKAAAIRSQLDAASKLMEMASATRSDVLRAVYFSHAAMRIGAASRIAATPEHGNDLVMTTLAVPHIPKGE